MQILSDNDRLLNELKIELSNKGFEVIKEDIDDVSSDKRYMGACSFLAIFGGVASLVTIVDYLERKFPDFKAWILTDTLEMSADEYLEMSDNARKAVEENFKVVIKRR